MYTYQHHSFLCLINLLYMHELFLLIKSFYNFRWYRTKTGIGCAMFLKNGLFYLQRKRKVSEAVLF